MKEVEEEFQALLWAARQWSQLSPTQRTDQKWVDLVSCCRVLREKYALPMHPMDDDLYKEGLGLLDCGAHG